MRILVIGDSCVDIFRYGEVNRLAPEAPVPVIIPDYETSNPGMASNVFMNLKSLGCDVEIITNKKQIKKVRYICSKYNHLLLRVDESDICEGIKESYDLDSINWENYDSIIISDYCKGFLGENDIEIISNKHNCVFLDTKKVLGDWANNVLFIKINNSEWIRSKEILENNSILNYKTIVTKGKYGCYFNDKVYPTKEVPVKDVSGAGDTFLSALVFEYIKTKDIEKSINFAQKCTTIVVQKPGVSTI